MKQILRSLIILTVAFYVSCQVCIQHDSCTCRFDDGQASKRLGISDGLINLHRISNDGEPILFDAGPKDMYYYTPCSTYPCTSTTDSAVCLAHTKNLGDLKGAKFVTNNSETYKDSQPLVSLIYHATDTNITSQVDLVCRTYNQFRYIKPINETAYLFSLYSPCACINGCLDPGLSAGTILVLIFFSVVLLYLGTGCLYRKAVLGATGQEIIPNLKFWSSLPGYIRDGYLFFLSPCLGDRATDRVYERL